MTAPVCVVLATGSRSLRGVPGAREWGMALLDAELAEADVLVVGDTDDDTPDGWARAVARARGVRGCVYRCFGPDAGWIVDLAGTRLARWTPDAPPARRDPRALWAAWCLHRDRVMAQHTAKRVAAGRASARVLALVDPASRTHGTQYTVDRARHLGLTPRVETWGATARVSPGAPCAG